MVTAEDLTSLLIAIIAVTAVETGIRSVASSSTVMTRAMVVGTARAKAQHRFLAERDFLPKRLKRRISTL